MNPAINKTVLMQRIAKKVILAANRIGALTATGTQSALRCGGVVCKEGGKYYVETGLVGIDLPKFGDDHLPARLAGLWVN
jgi:hypothetical protein